ncbi:Molybdopterin-guanine dinucleotide biosynthesis protein MobA [Caballeronia sordidicola]|uniref:Molybdopterin-guanine dinucleotide biosynthesis protein MobA n=1 Tax=Caballeronia sordidicola TaxID=196367 RepID=A0A242M3L4_CABSO|nr:Molybdopterin-guanine dinucleotide biosynthesis protein MobA [Caballeronia sordidicola]
MTQPSPPP